MPKKNAKVPAIFDGSPDDPADFWMNAHPIKRPAKISGSIERNPKLPDNNLYRIGDSGPVFVVLGNGVEPDGTIWCADWITGEPRWIDRTALTPLEDALQPTDAEIERRAIAWAKLGHADAAWWLGWYHETYNKLQSLYYYIASMRMNPGRYASFFDRVICDTRYGGGPEAAKAIAQLEEIKTKYFSPNWGDALEMAGKIQDGGRAKRRSRASRKPSTS